MENKKTNYYKKVIKYVFPHTLPVLTGFLFLGIAFGVLMQKHGYNALWTTFMSAVCFCGSMQFVSLTFFATAFNPLLAFIMSLVVNARHLFYGISMLGNYKGTGKLKNFLILTLCDETFSINTSVPCPSDIEKKHFYFAISLFNYLYWVLGSFLGGIAGELIKFNTKGLDFALTALFVVLFIEQIKSKDNRLMGLFGVLTTLVCLIVFKNNVFIIPSMLLILGILALNYYSKNKNSAQKTNTEKSEDKSI